MGLIGEAVEQENLLARALDIAQDIATNTAPVSVALTKALMWQNLSANIPQLMETEGRLINWLGDTPDVKEGVSAFMQKRDPKWQMSPTNDIPEEFAELTRRSKG